MTGSVYHHQDVSKSLICRSLFIFAAILNYCIPLISFPAHGQFENQSFRFKHITVGQGLSHSDAMCVAEDKAGFIWIGTNKGIDRYDGYKLKKYELPINEKVGLRGNRVRALQIDKFGTLWVGTEGAGVLWYNADLDKFLSLSDRVKVSKFSAPVNRLTTADINAITLDKQGNIWVGTSQDGLFEISIADSRTIKSIRQIRVGKMLTSQPYINKLTVDKGGHIWIGTLGAGLMRLNSKTNGSTPAIAALTRIVSVPSNDIRALHTDRNGSVWVGTDDQVFWIDRLQLTRRQVIQPRALRRHFLDVGSLYVDSFNRLWVGTNFGLLLFNAKAPSPASAPVEEQQVQTFLPNENDKFSINSLRVHAMHEDRFQNFWLATSAGGVNQLSFRAKPFWQIRQSTAERNQSDMYVNAICKDEKRNQLWIGTRSGLTLYDLEKKIFRNFLEREIAGVKIGIDVSALCLSTNDRLWIGTRYHGLFTCQAGDGSSLKPVQSHPNAPDWGGLSIERIVEDQKGFIWLATFTRGIVRFDPKGKYLATYNVVNSKLPTDQVTNVFIDDKDDILWACTRDAGLLKLRIWPDSLQLLRQFIHDKDNANTLLTNYTWPVLKDKRGNLWIGTIGGGLHRLFKNAQGQEVVERYLRWLPETDVETLLSDQSGNLWIGGDGLYQFNPVTKRMLRYDESDGLPSNAFKVGAAYQSIDGVLFMGGINGVTYFSPPAIYPNSSPTPMQITALRVRNKIIAVGDTLDGRVLLSRPFSSVPTVKLKSKENDFSIDFVGLNYANPYKQRYAYLLEGHNKNWVYVSAEQRTATFSNLPAGDYTFYLKGSNDDGVWGPKKATMHLTIYPPWWKTWWAYLLYLAFVGGSLWLYRRTEMEQQALKNRLILEQINLEKEREVTDTKVRFFTNVSHELRTPLTLILGPLEELTTMTGAAFEQSKDKLMLIYQQASKLLDLVNQLMDFRKVESGHIQIQASHGNIMSFITEIFLMFRLKAQQAQLDYAMEAENEAIFMFFDRDKLEVILTNLLSNAVKYTPSGGKIRLYVSVVGSSQESAVFHQGILHNNYLQLTLRDWGVGMQPQELEKIFDLYYQASHTETLRINGTGIGLSLVKQYVQAHQGEINVTSQPGHGTSFTLKLPFGRDHLGDNAIRQVAENTVNMSSVLPVHEMESQKEIDLDPAVSGRILLVEDSEDLAQYLQNLLAVSFEVFLARDGVEGWEMALELLPEIVVSDIMMPHMSGLELCQKLKQHPKTMHIPVVLLTARSTAVQELEGIETGADEYMTKPFTPRLLITKLAVMLKNRSQLREYYHRQILLEPTDVCVPSDEKRLLEKAMTIVEANLGDPGFTIPTLVKEMGMSQSAFYRHIKAITGQSAIEFIRDVRIKRAAQLLATGNLRVSEVSEMVGFENPKYFRKVFQQIYLVTPSEYARQYRQENSNLYPEC